MGFREWVPAIKCRVKSGIASRRERLNSGVLGENKEYGLHLFIIAPLRGHLRKKPVGFSRRLVCVVPTLQHSKPVFHAQTGLYEVA
jgi:hypothetical protein